MKNLHRPEATDCYSITAAHVNACVPAIICLLALLPVICANGQSSSGLPPDKSILWKTTSIPVCWETDDQGQETEKGWVREAVSASWESVTDVRFTGWGRCQNKATGIHITVADDRDGPRTLSLGNELNGLNGGMRLNFTLQRWGSDLVPSQLPNRKAAVKAIAVHEFGHALGLAHQHLRDSCYLCNEPIESTPREYRMVGELLVNDANALWFTPCDPFSVMNYCQGRYLNGGLLSEQDITNIQRLYPHPPSTIKQPWKLKFTHTCSLMRDTIAVEEIRSAGGLMIQGVREEYVLQKYRWYKVRIYVDGLPTDLATIKAIDYYLDPSFKEGSVRSTEPNTRFMLTFNAWGRFPIQAVVTFKDGREPRVLEFDIPEIEPITVSVPEVLKTRSGLITFPRNRTLQGKPGMIITTPPKP